MPKWGLAVLCAVALGALTTCSLNTQPPRALVTVRPSPGTARALEDRQCFALFVTNEGGNTTSTEMGNRLPSCFGLQGKYFGAYSYSAITGGAAQVSLSLGTHNFILLALDQAGPDCEGKPLSHFFPSAGLTANAYAVGSSGDVVVGTSTTAISITPASYTETNLTPGCPRLSEPCTGAMFCDTFTTLISTLISGHIPDVGGSPWVVEGSANSPSMENGRANVTANSGFTALFYSDAGDRDGTIAVNLILGTYGLSFSDLTILGRYSDANNYVGGYIDRNLSFCTIRIIERVAGSYHERSMSAPFECAVAQPVSATLDLRGPDVSFSYSGISISFETASPALLGTRVGFRSDASGSPFGAHEIDSIAVLP